ncbi:DDE-type integrase/transposase/recombinase [Nocardiopsis sp. LDBS1602]|nr:DDE-type integrase/transposase/recombinase [Nocardiopsis sp. LDBS1602]MEC3894403.1 DDE-type integrase/transposase/recombinase [Nocardiopsis sp. LDBS1602]
MYGARKVLAELNRQGHRVTRCTVQRLRKRAELHGISRTEQHRTTTRSTAPDTRPELVERAFTADAPNQPWVADITYIRTFNGWVYAAFVIDVHSRRVVGRQVSRSPRTDLALDALEMAVWNRSHVGRRIDGLVHHSDRGVQGGFNWLSQHLDQGVLKWDDLEAGVLLSPVDRRCAHQGDRPPTRARSSAGSGPESLKACRPRTPQQRAAFQRRSDHGGSVRLVEYRLSPCMRCLADTCRSLIARRSRCAKRGTWVFARSLGT